MLRRNEMLAEVKKIIEMASDTPTQPEHHAVWAEELSREIVERIEQLRGDNLS